MSVKNITNDQTFTSTVAHGIIPKNLPSRDLAFVYMLTKEKVVAKISSQYIQAMHEKNTEIATLNKKLNKKVVVDSRFLSTKNAALYIDVDPSFLAKRQGSEFKQGVHFFKPPNQSIVKWDIEALVAWIKAENKVSIIDDELDSLLKRR